MTYLIKDLPELEKPREKFKTSGLKQLSDADLLAIILRTGTNHCSVRDLAIKILLEMDGIENLTFSSLETLSKIKGIGEVKAITLLAAVELGKRASNYSTKKSSRINNAYHLYQLLEADLKNLTQEHFLAIFLNSKNEIIHQKTIFIGSANKSTVHPRDIYREAIKYSAVKLMVAHNHPSGDPTPSKEDIKFTSILAEAGKLLQIPLIDHIIIGQGTYYSFYDHVMK